MFAEPEQKVIAVARVSPKYPCNAHKYNTSNVKQSIESNI
jgi:hypothetical protein